MQEANGQEPARAQGQETETLYALHEEFRCSGGAQLNTQALGTPAVCDEQKLVGIPDTSATAVLVPKTPASVEATSETVESITREGSDGPHAHAI